MSSIGRKLLSSALYTGSVKQFAELHLFPELFRDSEVMLFNLVMDHFVKYGVLPHPDTVEGTKGFDGALCAAPEPPEFYLAEVEKRWLHSEIKGAMNKASEFMGSAVLGNMQGSDPDKAIDSLFQSLSELQVKRSRSLIINFSDAEELIHAEYIAQKTAGDEYSVPFGWPHLDDMAGGMRAGDFVSVAGRPGMGKTFMLLYIALHSFLTNRTPLFVSMEMNATIILQRLAAIYTSKNLTHLIKAEMSSVAYKQMRAALKKLLDTKANLWIVDGNLTANLDQVILLAKQLQPSSVLIDGAYLLSHSNPKLDKWTRIADNAEVAKKQIAQNMGIPVVASYQLSRGKNKGKDKADGLEDIYGSDAMGQLSSVSLGLLESDSIETERVRKVSILKGRNGEKGSFDIHWNFMKMDFSEVAKEEKTEDLQFIG